MKLTYPYYNMPGPPTEPPECFEKPERPMSEYKLTFTLDLPKGLDEAAISTKFQSIMDLVEGAVSVTSEDSSERLSGKATDELIDLINELRS